MNAAKEIYLQVIGERLPPEAIGSLWVVVRERNRDDSGEEIHDEGDPMHVAVHDVASLRTHQLT